MEETKAEAPHPSEPVSFIEEKRILATAAIVLVADQITKLIVIRTIGSSEIEIIIPGMLKFVNWHNSGAAWSMFQDSSLPLAALSVVALIALIKYRHHFETHTPTGKIAVGLLIGGIVGNLIDRISYNYVIDFIYVYVIRSNGKELPWPAFNIADMGICIGVGMLFLLAWREGVSEGETEKDS